MGFFMSFPEGCSVDDRGGVLSLFFLEQESVPVARSAMMMMVCI